MAFFFSLKEHVLLGFFFSLFFTLALPGFVNCLRWLPAYLLITSWQLPHSSSRNWGNLNLHHPPFFPGLHSMFFPISNPKKNLRWRWWPSIKCYAYKIHFGFYFSDKTVPGNMTRLCKWRCGVGGGAQPIK